MSDFRGSKSDVRGEGAASGSKYQKKVYCDDEQEIIGQIVPTEKEYRSGNPLILEFHMKRRRQVGRTIKAGQ